MTVLGTTALTYADWAARVDPDGKTGTIVNLLSQNNEILKDMLVLEGNLPTGHKTIIRTGIPSATWRLLNQGVPTTKSTTAQIIETCGMLETYSQIDKSLADLNGNTADFRLSEDMAFMEGINQQMASTLFYGNTSVNPERFLGLAPRYNVTNTATASIAANVIDASGTGSANTSIWMVSWGPNTVHGIFPKGQKAGLQHIDMGEWPVTDANGNLFQAYRSHFKWDMGIAVRDWRFAVRIANIDTTTSAGGLLSTTPPDLRKLLIRAVNRLPVAPVRASAVQDSDAPQKLETGRTAIYVNRVVRTYLETQLLAPVAGTNYITMQQWDGEPVLTFRGIPIRTVDQLVNNETRVT